MVSACPALPHSAFSRASLCLRLELEAEIRAGSLRGFQCIAPHVVHLSTRLASSQLLAIELNMIPARGQGLMTRCVTNVRQNSRRLLKGRVFEPLSAECCTCENSVSKACVVFWNIWLDMIILL